MHVCMMCVSRNPQKAVGERELRGAGTRETLCARRNSPECRVLEEH